MYDALNPRWASTLVGCVAALLVPIPFVFRRFVLLFWNIEIVLMLEVLRYGETIRMKSKHAPTVVVKPKEKKLDEEV